VSDHNPIFDLDATLAGIGRTLQDVSRDVRGIDATLAEASLERCRGARFALVERVAADLFARSLESRVVNGMPPMDSGRRIAVDCRRYAEILATELYGLEPEERS